MFSKYNLQLSLRKRFTMFICELSFQTEKIQKDTFLSHNKKKHPLSIQTKRVPLFRY